MYLKMFLEVFGGLGIFLYGMGHMSGGMQKIAGDRLKKILSHLTGNRFLAITMGIIVTMFVQSSSVSTVMTIGFVNASLLTLQQGLGVILGANVGTTITGWILVLKIGAYGLPIAGVSAIFYSFLRKESSKNKALTLMGLGLIFFGLDIMSNGLKPIRTMPEFIALFSIFDAAPNGVISYVGAIKAAFVGAMVTAVVQSSSATLGITIVLATQGTINYETAVALVLGENIGTTITAVLASLKATANAKRAAYAHCLINIIGATWIMAIFPWYIKFLSSIKDPAENITMMIAGAHTAFNVINVMFFIPFINPLANLLKKIVPDDRKDNVIVKVTHLNELMADMPSVVIGQTKDEILEMGRIINKTFSEISDVYQDRDVVDIVLKETIKTEELLDLFEKEITDVNFFILHKGLVEEDVDETRKNLIICEELETISDYQLRITKALKKLIKNGIYLDEERKQIVVNLHEDIVEIFKNLMIGYSQESKDAFVLALKKCNKIKGTYNRAREKHLSDIASDLKDSNLSTGYMDVLNFYRRIKEHMQAVIEVYIEI